jgi:hypothetical protein
LLSSIKKWMPDRQREFYSDLHLDFSLFSLQKASRKSEKRLCDTFHSRSRQKREQGGCHAMTCPSQVRLVSQGREERGCYLVG